MNVNFPGGARGGAENWPNLLKADQNYGFPDVPEIFCRKDKTFGLLGIPGIF